MANIKLMAQTVDRCLHGSVNKLRRRVKMSGVSTVMLTVKV